MTQLSENQWRELCEKLDLAAVMVARCATILDMDVDLDPQALQAKQIEAGLMVLHRNVEALNAKRSSMTP